MTDPWDDEIFPDKKIAVYGTFEAYLPVKEIASRKRKDGSIEHYLQTKNERKVMNGRFEFHGIGRDLRKAVRLAHQVVPKGFVDISAEEFLENPEKFSFEGEWIEMKIES